MIYYMIWFLFDTSYRIAQLFLHGYNAWHDESPNFTNIPAIRWHRGPQQHKKARSSRHQERFCLGLSEGATLPGPSSKYGRSLFPILNREFITLNKRTEPSLILNSSPNYCKRSQPSRRGGSSSIEVGPVGGGGYIGCWWGIWDNKRGIHSPPYSSRYLINFS